MIHKLFNIDLKLRYIDRYKNDTEYYAVSINPIQLLIVISINQRIKSCCKVSLF